MKLRLVLLYGNNIDFKTAQYDPDYGVATVKSRRWLRKGIHTRYLVDLEHLFYPVGKLNRVAHVLVDAHLRKSIKPERVRDEKNPEIKINVAKDPDPRLKARLDYMNEQTFWGSLILKMRIPLHMVIMIAFAGAGIYSFIRMLLSAFGYRIP